MIKKIFIILFLLILGILSFGADYDEPFWQIHFSYTADKPNHQPVDDTGIKAPKIKEKYENYKKELKATVLKKGLKKYLDETYSDRIDLNDEFISLYQVTSENLKYSENKDGKFNILDNAKVGIGNRTLKVKYDEKELYYKDLYLLSKALTEEEDTKWREDIKFVNEKAKERIQLWNTYYENVRKPQFFWEEWVNMIAVTEEGYIIEEPKENQWVLFHPSVMADINDDEFRPSIGLEIIGLRKYEKKTYYRDSKGLSLLVSINDKEDDDLGIGIAGNWNDTKVGIIYRDTDRDVSKWWLTFSLDIAQFFDKGEIRIDEGAVREDIVKELMK